jgi:antitoxin component YwqK of YwqJK toxin-antitoxin module
MLSESHGPEGSKYYINGEQVRKIIYDDKRKLFDNLLKCRPCYLITLNLDQKPIIEAVSYGECMVGSWIEYHKNGRIKSIGQYKENTTGDWSNIYDRGYCSVRVGEWKYFDMNGKLIKVEHYNNGTLVQ